MKDNDMEKKEIKQRMICMCDFPIGIGCEFSGLHPCLIASVDVRNEKSPNVYVFPITHAIRKWQPTHFLLFKKNYPFLKHIQNTIICESGREISKIRIQRILGMVSEEDFEKILNIKKYVFEEYLY